MRNKIFMILLFMPMLIRAQKLNKYWLELSDKNGSPYCTCRPAEFLSLRAIERREKARIPVVENDLPVSPAYLSILRQNGFAIHSVSRWLNAVVLIADSASIVRARALPFVKKTVYLGPHLKFRNPPNRPAKKRVPLGEPWPNPGGPANPAGYATMQNSQLFLPVLHAAGYRGQGIQVAVMDGGFTNADTITLFDSVALAGRMIPAWDFVERDSGLFEAANHGTSVLSVMAGNLPGYFVGAAPDATYFLLKTEDTGGEYPIEEANWIAGAEWADSTGVDIINASLGYTVFNDTTLGHHYDELDGKTAIGSRGAAIAATKGMIICNAAGNEGDGAWHYIGVPADAPGIVSVGAVDRNDDKASFSSFGPTFDGRIKPDLVAPGDMEVVAGGSGIDLALSSGTSIASPMLAGALAALWSAVPEKTAREVLDAVYSTSDQYEHPDNSRGYGLPDMTSSWLSLTGFSHARSFYSFQRNPDEIQLLVVQEAGDQLLNAALYDWAGHEVPAKNISWNNQQIGTLHLNFNGSLPPGYYQIKLVREKDMQWISCPLTH